MDSLRKVSCKAFPPRVLLYSPVYVYLERNEKFISVKLPFQFFTESELEKLSKYKNFFLPNSVLKLDKIRQRGVSIRNALGLTEKISIRAMDETIRVSLDPAPWEVAPVVLAECRQLWIEADELSFEAISVLVDEICGPIEGPSLVAKYDADVVEAEQAVLIANTAVLIGLHLGYIDPKFLRKMRQVAYSGAEVGSGERALLSAARELVSKAALRKIKKDTLKSSDHPLVKQMGQIFGDGEPDSKKKSDKKPEVAA